MRQNTKRQNADQQSADPLQMLTGLLGLLIGAGKFEQDERQIQLAKQQQQFRQEQTGPMMENEQSSQLIRLLGDPIFGRMVDPNLANQQFEQSGLGRLLTGQVAQPGLPQLQGATPQTAALQQIRKVYGTN